jgi:hypothetical protein
VRRAIVTLGGVAGQRFGPPRTTFTGGDGTYEFKGVAAGTYSVMVRPNSFQAQYTNALVISRITLADGEVKEVNSALQRAGAIVGRVVDELGEPLSGISVTIVGVDRRGVSSAAQLSDEFGRYRIFHLLPGNYYVKAQAQSGLDPDNVGFLDTFYPATYRREDATLVRVRGGQDTEIGDLRLTRARMMHIQGAVVDSQGRPAPPGLTRVALDYREGAGGGSRMERNPDTQSGFLFDRRPPGNYTISAWIRGEDTDDANEFAAMTVMVTDSDVEDVVIATKPTVNVTGQIVFESGAPPLKPGAVTVNLAAVNPRAMSFTQTHPATVGADLQFTIRRIGGEFMLRPAGLPERWILKAVLRGTDDITDKPVEFRAEDSGRVRVIVTNRWASITGTISNDRGEPMRDYRVVVFSEDRAAWFGRATRFRIAGVMQDGRFAARGLPGGRYYVAAVPIARMISDFEIDAAFLEPLVKDATFVVLGDDEERQVDLKVAAGSGG